MSSYYIDMTQSIDILEVSSEIKKLLNDENICTLYELTEKNRSSLKKIGCTPVQIGDIEIQLQLNGLDLNMKH